MARCIRHSTCWTTSRLPSELGTLPADLVRDAAMVKLQMVGLKPEHATRMPADLSGA